jgi:hypothetical protein
MGIVKPGCDVQAPQLADDATCNSLDLRLILAWVSWG